MRTHISLVLGILWLAATLVSCKTQKQPVQSIPVYGEDSETSFDGIPPKVVSAVRSNMKARMEDSPEDSIPSRFSRIDRKNIQIGIPYEIFLIQADALEKAEAPGFDGLALSLYHVPIIDSSGEEHVTMSALPKENGEIYSSGFHMGGMYRYTSFLEAHKCGKTSRRIVIRRVPRSGYPRAFKFLGCLGPEQTLESGRYWAIEDMGNQLDELDTTEYSWQQVFEKIATYYRDIKKEGRVPWR